MKHYLVFRLHFLHKNYFSHSSHVILDVLWISFWKKLFHAPTATYILHLCVHFYLHSDNVTAQVFSYLPNWNARRVSLRTIVQLGSGLSWTLTPKIGLHHHPPPIPSLVLSSVSRDWRSSSTSSLRPSQSLWRDILTFVFWKNKWKS